MADATSTPNILVVDDTVENLRLLSNMLGEHGYETRPVTNGSQALQAAVLDPPDLVLLDINMPEMNGYEVCEKLKSLEAVADVPVIFLTALSETTDKVKAFQVGGVDYITKPFQIEEVVARVSAHLGLRRARRELALNLERLQALEKLRDDLVHMVVHDMRSPLMVLMAHLDFLKLGIPGLSDESAEDLRAAILASSTLNQMANDLLDVSRMESGKLPLARTPCDLSGLARDVTSELAGLARGHILEVDDTVAARAICDVSVVRRVLHNLIGNAIKHTPEGGRIVVSFVAGDDRIRVCIEDEGPGIPPAAREKIFEKFGTVETRKNERYHSAGLGLAFCKLAVDAHDGAIGVDARAPRGSTFWFELPS